MKILGVRLLLNDLWQKRLYWVPYIIARYEVSIISGVNETRTDGISYFLKFLDVIFTEKTMLLFYHVIIFLQQIIRLF